MAAALMSLAVSTATYAGNKARGTVKIRMIETTDVHGRFFPYDFIRQQPVGGSLARVSSYVDSLRTIYGDNLLLMDAGDVLQGQPIVTYYNYVRTDAENIASSVSNYMRYDVRTMGNHDVETGHAVYDKWVKEMTCPMLGANITNTATAQPYYKPYIVFKRGGVKIAVIGLITPGVPSWLSETLWSGMHFEDAVESAKKWMDIVKKNERPDIIVGLFHTGIHDRSKTNGSLNDATLEIARRVPGFDVIFYGHDHATHYEEVKSSDGSTTIIVNPANNAMNVADAEFVVDKKSKKLSVNIVDISQKKVDEGFMKTFEQQIEEVKRYVDTEVGSFATSMTSRDCYFGNSSMVDFIHDVMLSVSHADVSFASPLSFDVTVKAGPATLSDMYKLYSYENELCVIDLTGKEIKRYLEKSYERWATTMTSPDDHLLRVSEGDAGRDKFFGLASPFYNLDSAAGINYVVDVTKPAGQRVNITTMADGTPFDEARHYRVAVNSYRAAGGGGLLTNGAGIEKAKLEDRIVWRGDHTLRDYIIEYVRTKGKVEVAPHNNWSFVPAEWTVPAAQRDRLLLFPDEKK
ncbi:bifunctional UDP-sugar hydrolase/5'-nucleotidase [uncultured Prevotella sp.]|uniref:bifunctional metallophosphatase/5'-nucleotidase n=1 Tax=uncultured Prevotella sp. TaxID=159272 RepID=UPI0025D2133B|nr:bifunctional UDP-sugar hydrolase/5'-nucleotidase [uncultured Prevotella sp.]